MSTRTKRISEADESATLSVGLTVNGRPRTIVFEPRTTLLDALRDMLALSGTKKGCDRGECGACTVHVDGRRVLSCMTLAAMQEGRRITTIEGLAADGRLAPIQEAFVSADALQCGFCTSGMVMSCKALLDRRPRPSREEIRHAVAGNLCRCGTYPHVFEAVERAAGIRRAEGGRRETEDGISNSAVRLAGDPRVDAALADALEEA